MSTVEEIAARNTIDPRLIADEALADLRRLTVSRVIPFAGRFGEWLHGWLDTEQARRITTPETATVGHCLALPTNLASWSDREVGEGMVAATRLSCYCTHDPQLGLLLDRVCEVFAGEACVRLSGDHQ